MGTPAAQPGSRRSSTTRPAAAELATLRLSLQGELVRNYLQLRVQDRQAQLLEQTVVAYQRSLTLTQNQYRAGIAPRSTSPRRPPSCATPRPS